MNRYIMKLALVFLIALPAYASESNCMDPLACGGSAQANSIEAVLHDGTPNTDTPQASQAIVQQFYDLFNARQVDPLVGLFADNFSHNYNGVRAVSKESFIGFMRNAMVYYDERVRDIVFMMSADGRHGATKFMVDGVYKSIDPSLNIPAHNQTYTLSVLDYFEIEDGKILSGSCYFDEADYREQLLKSDVSQ